MPDLLRNMSRIYSERNWSLYALLDQSLDPRGPEMLHEIAEDYLTKGSVILDVGCRNAAHLIELVRAHDAAGVGIDPVVVHLEQAIAAVAEAGLARDIQIVRAIMQALPFPGSRFDFVWCRDVLTHIDALPAAMAEVARVLAPGGRVLVHTTFATERFEPSDARLLRQHLGTAASSLVERNVEDAFAVAGLTVERKERIGTEWREHAEERTQPASRALLRLARLRRQRAMIVDRYDEETCDHVEANLQWEVLQFLGKLEPTVYVLAPPR